MITASKLPWSVVKRTFSCVLNNTSEHERLQAPPRYSSTNIEMKLSLDTISTEAKLLSHTR
jgi:hypothetical protein